MNSLMGSVRQNLLVSFRLEVYRQMSFCIALFFRQFTWMGRKLKHPFSVTVVGSACLASEGTLKILTALFMRLVGK